MKRVFNFVFAAVAILSVASCAKEFAEISEVAEGNKTTLRFSFGAVETKTALDAGKTVWAAGDSILVTDGTNKVKVGIPASFAGASEAEIDVDMTTLTSDNLYAVYPPQAFASVSGGKVNVKVLNDQSGNFEEANICVAKASDYVFSMKNATAVLKIRVAEDIETVMISASSADTLAGTVAVTYTDAETPLQISATSPGKSIKVTTGGLDGDYYVAVVPGTYSEFSMTALTLTGKTQKKNTTGKSLAINDLADLGVIGDDLAGAALEGEGTEDEPFLIKDIADITALASIVNLGQDYNGLYFKVLNNIEGVTTPIGTYDGEDYYFRGTFDGNNKTITLNIGDSDSSNSCAALFGDVGDGADIHDVIVDGTVKGTSLTAGIAGCINAGKTGVKITNCTNNASVSGTTQVAGIVGYMDATVASNLVIEGCVNNGDVTGTSTKVAGIVGAAQGNGVQKIVRNCTNNGKITGSNNVAGMVGYSYFVKFNDCINTGDILATGDVATSVYILNVGTMKFGYGANDYTNGVGGISGWTQNESITGCTNSGKVEGFVKIGGICGVNYWCSVTDCNNSGDITGRGNYAHRTDSSSGLDFGSIAGGIVGWTNGAGNITRCNNSGMITGKGGTGGIVGLFQAGTAGAVPTVQNCKNTGEVYAEAKASGNATTNAGAGGIAGITWSYNTSRYIKILSCENTGSVTNTNKIAGGIVGMLYDANNSVNALVEKCVNSGDVTSPYYVGGIAGYDRSRATGGGAIVRNCENHGSITGTRTDDNGECAGGIVGANNGSSKHFIYNCYNDGNVCYKVAAHVKPYCGGIIGQCVPTAGSLIQNCYNAGFVGLLGEGEAAAGAEATLGGIVGNHGTASVMSCSYSLNTACAQLVGTGSKAVGANVVAFDDNGVFESQVLVNNKDCSNILEALNAWVNGSSTYYPWVAGELYPEFSK